LYTERCWLLALQLTEECLTLLARSPVSANYFPPGHRIILNADCSVHHMFCFCITVFMLLFGDWIQQHLMMLLCWWYGQ